MTMLGLLTIGQAPRPDGLARDVQQIVGPHIKVIERGALDGFSQEELAQARPAAGDYLLVTLLADGTSVRIAKRPILDRLQQQIDCLEAEDRVNATLLMCTGSFPAFRHRSPLIQPQHALYGVVIGLAGTRPVGSLIPLPEQVDQARQKWREMGAATALVFPADPYGESPHAAIEEAATQAREQGAGILFMDCFGYDLAMGAVARQAFGGPVIVARSLAARLAAEVMA